MKHALTAICLAWCGTVLATDISGTVKIGRTDYAMLMVGYVGLDVSKNILRSSCGMTVGKSSSTTSVWCETYKPRNSELHCKNGAFFYKHTALPPGTYYVYAKLGAGLIKGHVVEVKRQSDQTTRNIDLSTQRTGHLSLSFRSKGDWSVQIAPANAMGKSLIKGLDLSSQLGMECKVIKGKALFKHLPAGKYIVQCLQITKGGGNGESSWQAFEVSGTFSVEVVAGKTLEYQLN